jgi:hypothetical protein
MTLKNIEKPLDRCNQLLELLRTCPALCTLILQAIHPAEVVWSCLINPLLWPEPWLLFLFAWIQLYPTSFAPWPSKLV